MDHRERPSTVDAGFWSTGFRDRQTRTSRWQTLDEEVSYGAQALDRAVVAEDQIRTVLETFCNAAVQNERSSPAAPTCR